MKKTVSTSLAFLIAVMALFSFSIPAYAAGYYVHDPMANPKAAADIVVNPNAVYGYSPDPDSPRLGVYAQYDWSDKAFVAKMRQEREEYHESVKELYQIKEKMQAEGKSVEEIAKAVSDRRNEIRLECYKNDPEGLAKLKESNLKTFGNENGGTPEYFYKKYGSWETVIEKAFSTNAGADACLGLYDKYYDTYIIDSNTNQSTTGSISPSTSPAKPDNKPATADSSKTSPKTGDESIAVILTGLVMTSAVVIGVATLKNRNE